MNTKHCPSNEMTIWEVDSPPELVRPSTQVISHPSGTTAIDFDIWEKPGRHLESIRQLSPSQVIDWCEKNATKLKNR
jgi:hypothetical protein